MFAFRGQSTVQEKAWTSCWRLCQNLYESRDEDHAEMVLPTLEMCRNFCQCLFNARHRSDESADSVLRVSFELNNHLWNNRNENLLGAFYERTLDFYWTLCHRLMKQGTSLPKETDALLRACWSLAEMLFNIRQNKRERRGEDEELLGSAVQACWELCDLFREGWSRVRPGDKGTPRPTQGGFLSCGQPHPPLRSQSALSSRSPPLANRPLSSQSYRDPKSFPPETPTTIFDEHDPLDTPSEPDHVPNILVLGPEQSNPGSSSVTSSNTSPQSNRRWSASGVSESSQHTSSTATASSSFPVEAHLNSIRLMLLQAAVNAGFQLRDGASSPPSAHASSASQRLRHLQGRNKALVSFVKALPGTAFGTSPTQTAILERYRNLVADWARVVNSGSSSTSASPSTAGGAEEKDARAVRRGMLIHGSEGERRTQVGDVARAVSWMMRSERNLWLEGLFGVVFGVGVQEAVAGAAAAAGWVVP